MDGQTSSERAGGNKEKKMKANQVIGRREEEKHTD